MKIDCAMKEERNGIKRLAKIQGVPESAIEDNKGVLGGLSLEVDDRYRDKMKKVCEEVGKNFEDNEDKPEKEQT